MAGERGWRSALMLGAAVAGEAAASAADRAPTTGEQVSPAPAPGPASEPASRMAELIRLWNVVRLFHVDERVMTPHWEGALAEAAGPALEAADDSEFRAIAARMMGRIRNGSSAMPAVAPAGPVADDPPFRLVSDRAVASCRGIGRAIVGGGQPQPGAEVQAAIRARGLILDCRGFPNDPPGFAERFAFGQWFSYSGFALYPKAVDRGSVRTRFHDGFPPDSGQSSGGYARGNADSAIGRVEPSERPGVRAPRIAFIADSAAPDPWPLAGGLKEAGLGGLVAQGPMPEARTYPFDGGRFRTSVKVADYVAPGGSVGFHPAACVASGAAEEAMRAARAVLDGGAVPACPPRVEPAGPEDGPAAATPVSAGPDSAPSLGERMVALAKLWGTMEYFFPYRDLADRPWSEALEAFVPVFAAARTREAYEDAVIRMSRLTDDSHVRVIGIRAHRSGQPASPPLYVRAIGGRFAIAGIHDPALGDRLRVGDEIVAVDGRPVAELAAELRQWIAASTPQSLVQRTASQLPLGPPGSEVRLTLRRPGEAPFDVAVQRRLPGAGPAGKPVTAGPSFRRIAADIGYIDLERLGRDEADPAIDALMDTKAIVFDLRGYPQGTAWPLAARLALDGRQGAVAAAFRRPVYRGPSEPQQWRTSFEQSIPTGAKPRYRGRIVVLIDDRAISQSEHTALFFKAAADPIFVGTATTGANGDVTRIALPGGLGVAFTGHDVRHPDGRRLQRSGIQPDVTIAPTLEGLRAGRDEVLEAGVKAARRR